MPLSDHERKLLAEMEAALAADDPRLVSTLSKEMRVKPGGNRIALGAIGIVAGLATMLGGLIAKVPVVGILGFILALVGAFLIITNFTSTEKKAQTSAESSSRTAKKSKKSWGDRLEERWEKRNDQ